MQTYNVFYLVSGDDEENQNISDTATLSFDAEDLDGLFAILREGEEDGSIQSKLETITFTPISAKLSLTKSPNTLRPIGKWN